MSVSRKLVLALFLVSLAPLSVFAEPAATVSYKIDGREFSYDQGRLEYYVEDGYISLTCERVEVVEDPNNKGMKREMTIGMTIQMAGDETGFKGTHRASTPDIMPTYFSWYEIVPVPDQEKKKIKDFLASLDSGDEAGMEIVLEIKSFGPAGGMVTGTFSGSLFDDDGKAYKITDGSFSVPRIDM